MSRKPEPRDHAASLVLDVEAVVLDVVERLEVLSAEQQVRALIDAAGHSDRRRRAEWIATARR